MKTAPNTLNMTEKQLSFIPKGASHLRDDVNEDETRCGVTSADVEIVEQEDDVTCGYCRALADGLWDWLESI